MKRYKVINCKSSDLEKKLNKTVNDKWMLKQILYPKGRDILIILQSLKIMDNSTQLDALRLQDSIQMQSQISSMMSNIIKQQDDLIKSIIRNLR